MRLFAVAASLCVLSQAAHAQTPSALARGSTVRITTFALPSLPSTRVVGTFDRYVNDTVYIAVPGSVSSQYYARNTIQTLEQTTHARHPFVERGLLGAFVGTGVGYAVYRINRNRQYVRPDVCYYENGIQYCQRGPKQFVGEDHKSPIYIGTSAGTILGLLAGWKSVRPVWNVVPFAELR